MSPFSIEALRFYNDYDSDTASLSGGGVIHKDTNRYERGWFYTGGIIMTSASNQYTVLIANDPYGSISLADATRTRVSMSANGSGYIGLSNASGTQTIILDGSTGKITCTGSNVANLSYTVVSTF